jgi:phosphatidate cytidylyltransferase
MSILFIVIAIHIILGGAGIAIVNRKLPAEKRKGNWLKYIVYFSLSIFIFASILGNKNLFLGVFMLISSAGLLELLYLSKQPSNKVFPDRFILVSLALFFILTIFSSVFVLLPKEIIAFTYATVLIFDGSSQIAGQIFGKRKVLPVLSPNKTWEGMIGGIISATISTAFLHNFVGISILQSIVFALGICIAAFMGDVAASVYKRAFSAKDFGKILPGQGGVLDRYDSFIVAGALVGILGIVSVFPLHNINTNIAFYLAYSLFNVNILFSGELMQGYLKVKPEFSRIFAHAVIGVCSIFMVYLFTSAWYIIVFCIHSAVFIYLTKRLGVLGSHNAVERKTYGSLLFFVGILASYLISLVSGDKALFILPVAILALSDPTASLTGLNLKSRNWPNLFSGLKSPKTYVGSFGFFVSCFIILYFGLRYFYSLEIQDLLIISFVISGLTTTAELISPRGSDNVAIPIVVSFAMVFLLR